MGASERANLTFYESIKIQGIIGSYGKAIWGSCNQSAGDENLLAGRTQMVKYEDRLGKKTSHSHKP
jgi:hypothetical protein